MNELDHSIYKRLVHLAADQALSVEQQYDLQMHLSQCEACRLYAAEMQSLGWSIGRALRLRWSAPRRSPIDAAGGVRRRLRTRQTNRFVSNTVLMAVKVGSLVLATLMIGGLLRPVSRVQRTFVPATSYYSSALPRFELMDGGTDGSSAAPWASVDDSRVYPAPAGRLHATQY